MQSVFIKYTLILLACLLFFAHKGEGQDATILLREQNPLYFNPSLSGSADYSRISLTYRNHLPAADNGFVTYGASFDTYMPNINSGIGLAIMRDQPGSKALNYNNAMLAYAYRITLGKNSSLQAGLLANLYYSVRDPNKLTFPDMWDTNGNYFENAEPYNISKSAGIDFGSGILYTNQHFKIDAALYHLGNKSNFLYHNNKIKFYTHAEFLIPLSHKETFANPYSNLRGFLKQSHLKPFINYGQQGSTKVIGIGLDLQTKNIRAGLWNRQDVKFNSIIFSAHIGFAANFLEIDYIFDIGKYGNNLHGLSATSHEIGLIFKFGEEKEY